MEFLREISPSTIEFYGGIILIGAVLLFIWLERKYPYTAGLPIFRQGFWMDLIWYTIIQSFLLKILIFDWIIAPLKIYFNLNEKGYISHWPIALLIIFFLLTHDLYIYWFHRWQHNSKMLWYTHEAHHSVQTVDWLAGSRSHALEIVINQTIEFLPIFFLLDVKTAAIIVPIKALCDAIWGMWIHSNIDVKTGKLQYFINGPEMHQWHHANHQEVFYANYATKFAFFDWIFGTAFLPGLKPFNWTIAKPIGFGLPYAFPNDFFSQSIYSMHRFNFQKVESAAWYKILQNFRQNTARFFLGKATCNDNINDKQKISIPNDIQCPDCGKTMSSFYFEQTPVKTCLSCQNQSFFPHISTTKNGS